MSAKGSLSYHVVRAVPSAVPPSFNGDMTLYAVNLFAMTAMFFLAAMLFGTQVYRVGKEWRFYRFRAAVTLWRLVLICASFAAALRFGGDALQLWGWNPNDPGMTARVLMAKRWIDPAAMPFAMLWMGISIIAGPGIERQLKNQPPPTVMWADGRVIRKVVGVVGLSFIMAIAAVAFR